MVSKKGKKTYPTLAQKHLNGADWGSAVMTCAGWPCCTSTSQGGGANGQMA